MSINPDDFKGLQEAYDHRCKICGHDDRMSIRNDRDVILKQLIIPKCLCICHRNPFINE